MRQIILISLFLSVISVEAQKIYLHLDRPLYVPGETVFYAIHFPQSLTQNSGVVKASWYDPQGKSVATSYMRVQAVGEGSFKVPYEMDSGFYRLQISAQDIDSKFVQLIEAAVPIYSMDLLNDSNNLLMQTPANNNETPVAGLLSLQYQVRDSVVLELPENAQRAVSIAVRDQELFRDIGLNTLFSATIDPGLRLVNSITMTGKASPPLDRQLLTFKMADQPNCFYAITNNDGAFQLELPDFIGEKTIRFIEDFSDSRTVEFNQEQLPAWSGKTLPWTPSIKGYLEYKQQRTAIYSLFNTLEVAAEYEPNPELNALQADLKIDATRYNLSDFKAFCREVSTPLKYIKGSFGMFNPVVRDMRTGSPLFIIDGQLTRDHDFLIQLDFAKLKEVLLFYDDTSISNYFGFAGYSGVVVINSKLGDIRVPAAMSTLDYPVSGYMRKLRFEPQYTNADDPVIQPVIYWGLHQSQSLWFQHTHDKGIFEADIVTIIDDELHRQSITYQVE